MSIIYDPEAKDWEWLPDSDEEVEAFFQIGKTVIVQKLTEKFASEAFNDWLNISKRQMFKA